ncbi:MAG: hypothetical protein CML56_00520 [Rhodobacteraceae bacterium]|nr:hypothetical protein [Paracoccaceae bacterium]
MIAAGIDLGGTKIEAHLFDVDWHFCDNLYLETPKTYELLIERLCEAIDWIEERSSGLPVGLGLAGLISTDSGKAITANLPCSGERLPADIEKRAGRYITYINDGRAFTLSEAVFGVAKGYKSVVGLILGTGTGGGSTYRGVMLNGAAGVAGEFGHISAPAHLVKEYNLPIVRCGCGKMGCIETIVSGPGMMRIAKAITGQTLTPPEIYSLRLSDSGMAKVWDIWCTLVSELCLTIDYAINPDVIVVGGGLSNMRQLISDLSCKMSESQFNGFNIPKLLRAQGDGASGARGAAYAAWLDTGHG